MVCFQLLFDLEGEEAGAPNDLNPFVDVMGLCSGTFILVVLK